MHDRIRSCQDQYGTWPAPISLDLPSALQRHTPDCPSACRTEAGGERVAGADGRRLPQVRAPEQPAAKRRRTATAPIKGVLTCQATSSLAEVIAIMANHDVHQVYVVDPDSKPLSAITMADVLRTVVNAAAPPTLTSVCRERLHDAGPGGFRRGGTPATPNAGEAAVRTSALPNESAATSGQSDRAMSVCTSVQSVPQVSLPTRPLEGSGSVVEASVVVGTAVQPDGDNGEPDAAGDPEPAPVAAAP